jgi:L-threonylcarbamoyladenylate synthase
MPFIDLHQALSLLNQDEIIAIPTETVYGLAAYAYQDRPIKKIYKIKNRPFRNPLIVHYHDVTQMSGDVLWTEPAIILAQTFWPGPLTIVLHQSASCRVSKLASAHLPSIAVRVPSHPILRLLLAQCAQPLAAPSANLSGRLSPTTAQHVKNFLDIPVLDGGPCAHGLESTIVDCRGYPQILRPGIISHHDIENALGALVSGSLPKWNSLSHLSPTDQPCAPGLLAHHYAPFKPLRLNAVHTDPDEGLLAFGPIMKSSSSMMQLSWEKNLQEAAQNLFAGLHELDRSTCARIAVMPIPHEGIGIAINERLSRAALAPR